MAAYNTKSVRAAHMVAEYWGELWYGVDDDDVVRTVEGLICASAAREFDRLAPEPRTAAARDWTRFGRPISICSMLRLIFPRYRAEAVAAKIKEVDTRIAGLVASVCSARKLAAGDAYEAAAQGLQSIVDTGRRFMEQAEAYRDS